MGQNSALDTQKFKFSMKIVEDNYNLLDVTNSTSDLVTVLTNLRAHWHTNLGYAKANELAVKVSGFLNNARKVINSQYLAMLSSANQYMLSQGGQIFQIERLNPKEIVCEKVAYDDPTPHIDDGDVDAVRESLNVSFGKLVTALSNIIPYVDSDQMFGYYASGDVNPRVVIQTTVTNTKNQLETLLREFNSTFNSDIDKDRIDVNRALDSSTVNN